MRGFRTWIAFAALTARITGLSTLPGLREGEASWRASNSESRRDDQLTYPFNGPASERAALRWMDGKLQEVTEHKSSAQGDELDDLRYDIKKRLEAMDASGGPGEDSWYEDLWERFIFGVSGVRIGEEDSGWEAPFEWREWEYDAPQKLDFGYSDKHLYAEVPKGGGSSKHFYSEAPPPIRWVLTPVKQKGLTFHVGRALISEIDAVCSVPQLPEELGPEETALRVLESKRGEHEWQRRLDPVRVLSISNFIGKATNIIANSAIVYAPECKAVHMDGKGGVEVDFAAFLWHKGAVLTDHEKGIDLRPLWLIDGQHRVRGLAQSKIGVDIEIPIILFPPSFSLGSSAKIFAEINTLQTKLTPLHTLFMQHRFSIPSPLRQRDFRVPWSTDDPETWDSRANHLSYECAAFLASNKGGPLRGLIKFLDQNSGREYISQAHQWVDFTRKWFLRGGPYPPHAKESQEVINHEVENFFRAFIATCNHSEWPDGKERWSMNTWNKGLLQRQSPSQALLRLYPTVWGQARKRTSHSPIPESVFRDVLRPLTWVDWTDSDLIGTFSASGERPRSALRIWMENAILHGKVYPRRAVMSKGHRSQAGRGILSPPANGDISISSETGWPTKGRPVKLRANRPLNSLPTSRWTVWDSDGVDRTGAVSSVPAEADHAEFALKFEGYMDQTEYVDVRVDWSNAVSPPGHGDLRIKRPRFSRR